MQEWRKLNQPLLTEKIQRRGWINSITHPEVSSTLPPPSLALVWDVERTLPLRQQWTGSTDPKLHRPPQTLLHLSSSPEKLRCYFQLKPNKNVIPLVEQPLGSTHHFPPVFDNICHWQDVSVLCSSTHPDSFQQQSRFRVHLSFQTLINHCKMHVDSPAK